ncbi:invasin, partial [Serratia sp. CY43514]
AEAGSGSYTATFTATTAGTGLTARLTLGGASANSTAYAIVVPAPVDSVLVNGHDFAPTAGFPTTGFVGAKFKLVLRNADVADFTWTSNQPWVSVNNGEVSFTAKGNGQTVTITGTAKNGGGTIAYTFRLQRWFTNMGNQTMTWGSANMTCTLPTIAELTKGPNVRGTGSLWSEWGGLMAYTTSGFVEGIYWTSEQSSNGNHYYVYLGIGYVIDSGGGGSYSVVCRQVL